MHVRGIITLVICTIARLAVADICDARYGTFETPAGFSFQHTGTIDSFRGKVTREGDGFTISFDIGGMAGIHMHESRRRDCTFYREHYINGIPAYTCIKRVDKGQEIATTICDLKRVKDPANFWAEITNDSDIAEFLLIVSTYKPKTKEHP